MATLSTDELERRLDAMREQARRGEVVNLFGFDLPPPRRWVVPDMLPSGCITLLNADGGVGKSYLALYFATAIAMGTTAFHRKVRQGRVLYLDFELDATEIMRRTYQILRGRGFDQHDARLYGNLFYLRCSGSLAEEHLQTSLNDLMARLQPDLVILDSLTIATAIDQNDSAIVTRAMRYVETLGTVLALDHIPASGAKDIRNARGLGSVMKRNIGRQSWNLAKNDDGTRTLHPTKANFGPDADKIEYRMSFVPDDRSPLSIVKFTKPSRNDPERLDAMPKKKRSKKTLDEKVADAARKYTLMAEEQDAYDAMRKANKPSQSKPNTSGFDEDERKAPF